MRVYECEACAAQPREQELCPSCLAARQLAGDLWVGRPGPIPPFMSTRAYSYDVPSSYPHLEQQVAATRKRRAKFALNSVYGKESHMPNHLQITLGTRIVAELRYHNDRDAHTIEFHAWFDGNLTPSEREIVLRNYLNELFKGQ